MNHQAAKLAALEKRKQALQLALAGVDYQTIADTVGYNSRQAAHKAVKSAIDMTIKPMAEDVKQMQLARLDKMLTAIWSQVTKGNLSAIDRAIKLEERRARLMGADAPTKTDVTSNNERIEFVIKPSIPDQVPPDTTGGK